MQYQRLFRFHDVRPFLPNYFVYWALNYYNHFGGGRNINDLFEVFDKNLNAEEAAKKLYNYFINNHFEKENATDQTKRITFINQDKNKYNIKVLEKDF